MNIDLNQPLTPGAPGADSFLKGLQGNILRSHGRSEAAHLFISFGAPENEEDMASMASNVREWITGLLDRGDITSAFVDEGNKEHTGTFHSLLLSSMGYRFLREKRPRDGSFRDGMRDRRGKLNDPSPQTWETAYRYEDHDKQVHALLIIADNDEDALDAKTNSVITELEALGLEVLVNERGHQQFNDDSLAVEHFGYRDGVSQPRFIVKPGDDPENPPPDVKFNQYSALKRVLEEDRLAPDNYGSFAVYRKLEQDVESFKAAIKNVATQLGQDPDFVGAQAVGRFRNGTPLALSGAPIGGYKAEGEGKFGYRSDRKGSKCPLHAHIRKVNPRRSLRGFFRKLLANEKKRRIARRGITYGKKGGKVGLIFICYQSDIKDQFEFIQRRWANSHNFSRRGTGLDPVIGQDGGPQEDNDHPNWPVQYDSEDRRRIAFGEHVRLRGGEYFFAPSMKGLRKLGTAR